MAKKTQKPVILAGRANKPFARRVARELDLKLSDVSIETFSDEEIQVAVNQDCRGRDVYCIQPTSMPANDSIMELLLMVHAVKAMRPKRITAVMPFFGYRRQEKVSIPGESLAFDLVAKLLNAAGVNRVLVIDLHKHRSAKFFKDNKIICKELRAFDVIVDYFKKKKLENLVVLAPDKGSAPGSEHYARELNVPLVKVSKQRSRKKLDTVSFTNFEGEVKGKNVLIIDDEINTAGTLIGVADILKERKANNIFFACTHAVLSGPAIERLEKSRLTEVVVTDTIYLPPKKRIAKIKVLSVAPLFAETIAKWSAR
ncbi:MAG: ribose-phosphate pyrophosphokinase [Candidatus Kerfeldbacteria bacterium]